MIASRNVMKTAFVLLITSTWCTLQAFATVPSLQCETPRPIIWATPTKYIAGTPSSRKRALKELNVVRGRWVVAYLSIQCGDCDRVARLLNRYVGLERILGVAQGSPEEVEQWANSLHLAYQVKSVSSKTLEELGAVILPTIVLYVNGIATGSRAPSTEAGWR
jgi:hypothetical protein